MSESDQVIDIERNQNVAIEVNNSPSVSVETVVEERVFVGWKRIIVGVSLISIMLIPLLGGAVASYLLRKDLHAPADPYNVWPNTVYRGQTKVNYVNTEDIGFSKLANSYLLIKNGQKDYFTVSDGKHADVYMAVYMVENLFSYRGFYTLHVVSSTDKSDLSPSFDITFMKEPSFLSRQMDTTRDRFNYRLELYQSPGVCLAAKLIDKLGNSKGKFANQKEAMTEIATRISNIIKSAPTEFYYPTSKKTGSYVLPEYHIDSGFHNQMFIQLADLREAKRKEFVEKELKNKKSPKALKIVEKPKFKKIEMQTLAELSA